MHRRPVGGGPRAPRHVEEPRALGLARVGAQEVTERLAYGVDAGLDERRPCPRRPWRSGAARARAAIFSATGAIARIVSAPASAMMTVPDGTLCAPIALRTICRTVAIFTNDVTVMKANGSNDTSASADDEDDRTRQKVVGARGRGHGGSFRSSGRLRGPERTRARTSAKTAARAARRFVRGQVARRHLAELGEARRRRRQRRTPCSPTWTR